MFNKSCSAVALFLLAIAFLTLVGCGGTSAPPSGGFGAVSAKLVWDGGKTTAKSVASAPASVATVRISISGPAMTTIQQDFPAASGSGAISNVPAGSGLTVTASALDAAGTILYQGAVGNVTVLAGQTTDVVTIIMLTPLTSITVTPATLTVGVGANQQFTATGTFSDSTTRDLTASVTWSSSSTSVTTIATSGLGTTVAAGSTTIGATSGTITGSTTLTVQVGGPTLTSITVTPADSIMQVGDSQQFTATGKYSDNSTKDLTTSVIWSPSTTAAFISTASGGMATAMAVGTPTITATYGAVSATTSLTVTYRTVTTIAGSSGYGSADGTGAAAQFNNAAGITTDGTNLYVADQLNHTIRKIVISTGVVTTIAGYPGIAGSADGTGAAARFYWPTGITTDGTNLYVADQGNHTIRKVVISTGAVTTFAGSSTYDSNYGWYADGIGAAARFGYPASLTTDGYNLYVTDCLNHNIRKIVISSAYVTTFAVPTIDNINVGFFSLFSGIATDGTNLYVSTSNINATETNYLVKINIATGTSSTPFNRIYSTGVLTDGTNLYVQTYNTTTKFVLSSGVNTTFTTGLGGMTMFGDTIYGTLGTIIVKVSLPHN